jgi:hypothetical protein
MKEEKELKEYKLEESLKTAELHEKGEITRFERDRRLKEIAKIVD